jgi:hypothetical protein
VTASLVADGDQSAGTPLTADDQAVEKKQDYRADYGADEACGFTVPIPADSLAQISRNERTDNSQYSREDKAFGLGFIAGHNELGDHTDDKANDNGPNDTHHVAPDLNRYSEEHYTERTGAISSLI